MYVNIYNIYIYIYIYYIYIYIYIIYANLLRNAIPKSDYPIPWSGDNQDQETF